MMLPHGTVQRGLFRFSGSKGRFAQRAGQGGLERRLASFACVDGPCPVDRVPPKTCPSQSGFTLVELLVVITIIGILISLLLPAVQSARAAARRLQNSNNLKQIGLALNLYEQAHGVLPPLRLLADTRAVSWSFHLLPYLEQQAVFDSHDHSKPVFDSVNKDSMRTTLSVFINPSRRRPVSDRPFDNNGQTSSVMTGGAAGDYAANRGWSVSGFGPWAFVPTESGPFFHGGCVDMAQIRDGTSNTLAIGDRWIPKPGTPMESYDTNFYSDHAFFSGDHPYLVCRGSEEGFPTSTDDPSPRKFGGPESTGAAFVFVDGHVGWLNPSIDLDVYRRLSLAASGEPIPGNAY